MSRAKEEIRTNRESQQEMSRRKGELSAANSTGHQDISHV